MFDVTIWGTVAAWFSALGTTGSFTAAAGYYIYDKWLESRAQAGRVRVIHAGSIHPFEVKLYNLSDESIFDITARGVRKSWEQVAADRAIVVTDKEKYMRVRADWEAHAIAWGSKKTFANTLVLPGADLDIDFGKNVPNSEYAQYYVLFRDAQTRLWKLELESLKPTRVRKREENRERMLLPSPYLHVKYKSKKVDDINRAHRERFDSIAKEVELEERGAKKASPQTGRPDR